MYNGFDDRRNRRRSPVDAANHDYNERGTAVSSSSGQVWQKDMTDIQLVAPDESSGTWTASSRHNHNLRRCNAPPVPSVLLPLQSAATASKHAYSNGHQYAGGAVMALAGKPSISNRAHDISQMLKRMHLSQSHVHSNCNRIRDLPQSNVDVMKNSNTSGAIRDVLDPVEMKPVENSRNLSRKSSHRNALNDNSSTARTMAAVTKKRSAAHPSSSGLFMQHSEKLSAYSSSSVRNGNQLPMITTHGDSAVTSVNGNRSSDHSSTNPQSLSAKRRATVSLFQQPQRRHQRQSRESSRPSLLRNSYNMRYSQPRSDCHKIPASNNVGGGISLSSSTSSGHFSADNQQITATSCLSSPTKASMGNATEHQKLQQQYKLQQQQLLNVRLELESLKRSKDQLAASLSSESQRCRLIEKVKTKEIESLTKRNAQSLSMVKQLQIEASQKTLELEKQEKELDNLRKLCTRMTKNRLQTPSISNQLPASSHHMDQPCAALTERHRTANSVYHRASSRFVADFSTTHRLSASGKMRNLALDHWTATLEMITSLIKRKRRIRPLEMENARLEERIRFMEKRQTKLMNADWNTSVNSESLRRRSIQDDWNILNSNLSYTRMQKSECEKRLNKLQSTCKDPHSCFEKILANMMTTKDAKSLLRHMFALLLDKGLEAATLAALNEELESENSQFQHTKLLRLNAIDHVISQTDSSVDVDEIILAPVMATASSEDEDFYPSPVATTKPSGH